MGSGFPLCELCCPPAELASGVAQATDRNANKLINQDPANASHRRRLLLSIEALHANFYHAHLDEGLVGEGIEEAKELIRTLDDLNSDI